MTHPRQICSCSVHVRPARRCRPTQPPRSPPGSAGHQRRRTNPHRAPPHPRPHADRLRPALGRRAATTHLRDRPRRHHAALRHHNIGEILARITRGLLRAAALEARLVSRPIREPATLATLTAASLRQPRAAQPEGGSAGAGEPRIAPAHARGHRGRDPPPPGRRRSRGYVSRPRDRAEQPAVAGTLRGHHQLRRQSHHLGRGHLRSTRPVADPPARRGATRGTGTDPAIRGEARHRPTLNKYPEPSRRDARGQPTAGPAVPIRPDFAGARTSSSVRGKSRQAIVE